MESNYLNGDEQFTIGGYPLGLTILDFWKFQFASLHNLKEYLAEFLIAKALGMEKPYNTDQWTLFDILYRNTRIEVKQTSYFHTWNSDGKVSSQRTFGISKAYSNRESNNLEKTFERQNDIYIFCLNIGETAEKSNPLVLENWEFYIVPTSVINDNCADNKTISLGRVKKLAKQKTDYLSIKSVVDKYIDNILREG